MCFYDQKVFLCGDFKWGHFREQCLAEYRTGETCGLKLVLSAIRVSHKCECCEKLEKKVLRFWKEEQRIVRWKSSGQESATLRHDITRSRTASIEAAHRTLRDLRRDILKLQYKREYPFASFDCESGPNFDNSNAGSVVENARDNSLPSIKHFAIFDNSRRKIDAEDEPLSSKSNLFMFKRLNPESPEGILGGNRDCKDSDNIQVDDQEQERWDLMLTVRLFWVAFESLISPDGTVRLPSGTLFTASRSGISPRIFEYVQSLKTDLLHAGLSSQLAEADTEIDYWLPRIMKALRSRDYTMEDTPRQWQRLLSTLREIRCRIQHSGILKVRHMPLTEEQQELIYSNLRLTHMTNYTGSQHKEEKPLLAQILRCQDVLGS